MGCWIYVMQNSTSIQSTILSELHLPWIFRIGQDKGIPSLFANFLVLLQRLECDRKQTCVNDKKVNHQRKMTCKREKQLNIHCLPADLFTIRIFTSSHVAQNISNFISQHTKKTITTTIETKTTTTTNSSTTKTTTTNKA